MASKITIPDLKKIRVTDPLFSHYAGMVAKKMIPVQWEILNGKQGQSRCFCIDNFRIAGGTLQGEPRGEALARDGRGALPEDGALLH